MNGNQLIDAVVQSVARHFAISVDQLLSGGKFRFQRRVAMYFAHRFTRQSLPKIGLNIGGVSHTVVVHAVITIRKEMAKNAAFATEIEELSEKIKLACSGKAGER